MKDIITVDVVLDTAGADSGASVSSKKRKRDEPADTAPAITKRAKPDMDPVKRYWHISQSSTDTFAEYLSRSFAK